MDVVFEHWSASWPVLIVYVALAAAHLAGLPADAGGTSKRDPSGAGP